MLLCFKQLNQNRKISKEDKRKVEGDQTSQDLASTHMYADSLGIVHY